MPPELLELDAALAALNAAAEETRLRLLLLLAESELTVSEIVAILGQSQPRVSRHLKLLVEAGFLERRREGAWAFFRLAQSGPAGVLARKLLASVDSKDPTLAGDGARLAETRAARAENAARYFADHADDWDDIRSLHVSEARVEAAIMEAVGHGRIRQLVDLGAGAGRMLELLAPRADRAIGVDFSSAMLAVARGRMEELKARNVQLRQGDVYALPVTRDSCDLAIMHQVLHYLEDPARALKEAARILSPGGRLVIVDFAPHDDESLRNDHAHRRLGFSHDEICDHVSRAGLEMILHRDLAPEPREGAKLTVSLWVVRDPRFIADVVPSKAVEAV